jgi:hypothetical protein
MARSSKGLAVDVEKARELELSQPCHVLEIVQAARRFQSVGGLSLCGDLAEALT